MFFHAHPDDEAISTAGTMRLSADAGHRVVLVVATRGEEGEVDPGFLDEGETLGERRVQETLASAAILGVARVEFLGYRDSGMMGTPENDNPECFWRADLDEAAGRLAAILRDEAADVVTMYDDHGGYGHPDHINVHRVGHRAAAIAATERVFEATMNRDAGRRRRSADPSLDPDERAALEARMATVGTPDAEISVAVDVRSVIAQKRAAMAAHPSQISADSWFLQLPDEAFLDAFGTEWFIRTVPPFTGSIPEDRDTFLI